MKTETELANLKVDSARAQIARYEKFGAQGLHAELQRMDSEYRKITARLVIALYVFHKNEWYNQFDCQTIDEYADKFLKGFNRRTVLAAISTVKYCIEEDLNIEKLIENQQLWSVRYLAQVPIPAENKKELLNLVVDGKITARQLVAKLGNSDDEGTEAKAEESNGSTLVATSNIPQMKTVDLHLSPDNYKLLNAVVAKARKEQDDVSYEQVIMDALLVYESANFGRNEASLKNIVARLQEQYGRPIIVLGPDKRIDALKEILKALEDHFHYDIIVVKQGSKKAALRAIRASEKHQIAKKADKGGGEE